MFAELRREDLFVERASTADIEDVVELVNKAFWPSHSKFLKDNDTSRQRVTDHYIRAVLLSAHDELYLLKEKVGQTLIGTILLQKNASEESGSAKFGLLARNLEEKYRSLNIGELLIGHVTAHVKELGKSCLKIEVVSTEDQEIAPSLRPLINYYIKNGFQETGKTMSFPRAHCLKEGVEINLIEMQRKVE